jgi:hypothetical protein
MATTSNLRFRRNAAQMHALAGVTREIHSSDANARRKYLRDFVAAFPNYEAVIDLPQIALQVRAADIVLVGDYHALPASQRFASSLFEQRTQPGDRPVVLAVETIVSRDQHILEEWWRREIDEHELRRRIRFNLDWGYDWQPFYELLVSGREHGEAIYGLDCLPRNDLRRIGARDRHAAHKIAQIRERHPYAAIVVLFGESHLAPQHLPRLVREELPNERLLTVLQNVDALYWQATGEKQESVNSVQVAHDVVCVFNATPLEKYESYRLSLARWAQEDVDVPDLAPTVHNLSDSLANFAGINRYSHRGIEPTFLVDLLPEIYPVESEEGLARLQSRLSENNIASAASMRRIEERGSAYLPQTNSLYVREFQMMYVAEEAARFLHHACRGLPEYGRPSNTGPSPDEFYRRVLENTVAYFGSRVLYPSRPAPEEENGEVTAALCRQSLKSALRGSFEAIAQELGYQLGSDLYRDYLTGRFTPRAFRRLLLTRLEEADVAKRTCLRLIARNRKKRPSSVDMQIARKPAGQFMRC